MRKVSLRKSPGLTSRKTIRRLLTLFLGLPISFLVSASPDKAIWLAPLDNLTHAQGFPAGASDYMKLFQDGATWPEQIPQVKVFKIYPYFAENVPDEKLAHIVRFLKAHHIKLAVEAGAMSASTCGSHVEGYGGEFLPKIAEKITRAGGHLDYLAMDEPMWFGHFSDGPNTCHASIESVAANVAANIKALRSVASDVEIGDVEPGVGPGSTNIYASELSRWASQYKLATGTPLSFLHLDINWFRPWVNSVQVIASILMKDSISFGVIYNGTSSDSTDEEWSRHAESSYLTLEMNGSVPDTAIFQTWTSYPSQVLPVDDPHSLTGIARNYTRRSTVLKVERQNDRLVGILAGSDGGGLPGRTISIEEHSSILADYVETIKTGGIVPQNATTAIFAIRINSECGCAGHANYEFHGAAYQQGPDIRIHKDFQNGLKGWTASGSAVFGLSTEPTSPHRLRVAAEALQSLNLNSNQFQVSGGRPFTAQFDGAMSDDSEGSGLYAIIFQDKSGREIKRHIIRPTSSWSPLGKITTGPGGAFASPDAKENQIVRFNYNGDENFRPAISNAWKHP